MRWAPNAYLGLTENVEISYNKTPDYDRKNAAFPVMDNAYCLPISQLYFQAYASADIYTDIFDGNRGTIWVMSASYGVTHASEIVLTIGPKVGDASTVDLYSPAKNVPASTKVTYVIEKPDFVINQPFYESTESPAIKCDYSLVIKAPGVTLKDGKQLTTSATAAGCGTYNLVIENPAKNLNDGLLRSGFYSLYFKEVGGTLSFDFASLPQVGYQVIRFNEGDSLDLTDTLDREIMLDIVKAGKEFSNDSFEVIYSDDDSLLEFITLTEEADKIGSLVYSEDDGVVYYQLDRGTVSFNKGDIDEDVAMPATTKEVLTGKTITLPTPATTTLANGKKFSGWKNEAGKFFAAGSEYTISVNGNETLTAVWGLAFSFVTGYENSDATPVVQNEILVGVGEKFVLPNIRGTIVNDGKYDLVFYGWNVNGNIRFAGETLVMDGTGLSATAVWVPAFYVAPSFTGESDGTFDAPYKSVVEAQHNIKVFFENAQNKAAYAAGAIVLKEDAVLDWTPAGPNSSFGGVTYYTTKGLAVEIGAPILFVGITSDVSLTLFNSSTQNDFTIGKSLLFDYLVLRSICRYNPIRVHTTGGSELSPAMLYFGPALTTSVPTTALPAEYASLTTHVWARFLIEPNTMTNVHIYGGDSWYGVYACNSKSSTNTYIGSHGDDTYPVVPVAQIVNSTTLSENVWNYYQYGGVVTKLNTGLQASGKPAVNEGVVNMYFYGGVVTTFMDGLDYSAATNSRNPSPIKRNMYFENFNGTIYTTHVNPEIRITSAAYGDAYYKLVSGTYYYSAISPNAIDSATFVNSNVTFTGSGLNLRAGAEVTYRQDETSVVTGTIVATKDIFKEDENTPNKFNPVTVALPDFSGAVSYTFNGSAWKQTMSVNYVTGYDQIKVTQSTEGMAGSQIALSDELRGQTVTVGGQEMTFYGWMINGKFYDAGDLAEMSESGLTATAVWVPVIFVDGVSGNDETADGTKTL